MNIQLAASTERDISSEQDLPMLEEVKFEGEPSLHVSMDVGEENNDDRLFNL